MTIKYPDTAPLPIVWWRFWGYGYCRSWLSDGTGVRFYFFKWRVLSYDAEVEEGSK